MAKKFYTEQDIEEMANRGQMVLDVCDNVVLTELAYEKAGRLGLKLNQINQLPPSAPVRPYLSQPIQNNENNNSCGCTNNTEINLTQRIKDAVALKLGNQVDPVLLETIISRVLNNIKVKQ